MSTSGDTILDRELKRALQRAKAEGIREAHALSFKSKWISVIREMLEARIAELETELSDG